MEVDEAPLAEGGKPVPHSKIFRPLKRQRLQPESDSDSEPTNADPPSASVQHDDQLTLIYEGLWRRQPVCVRAGNFRSPILEVEMDVFMASLIEEFGRGGLETLEKEQREVKAGAALDKMWRLLIMPVTIVSEHVRRLPSPE